MALGRGLKSGAVLGLGAVLLIGGPALAYLFLFQQKGGELERQTLTLLGVSAQRLDQEPLVSACFHNRFCIIAANDNSESAIDVAVFNESSLQRDGKQ